MTHPYLAPVITAFEANANPAEAEGMRRYMRDLFPYLGIKTPARSELMKAFYAQYGLPPQDEFPAIVREMWAMPEREYQYGAVGLLERCKGWWLPEHITLFEELVLKKPWWDTVDSLATHMIGGLVRKYPAVREERLPTWRTSESFWLRRVAILFQLNYKQDTDFNLLCDIIRENLGSKEFFINKAIGWALREYSKTDAGAVQKIVTETDLEPLSRREALKWLARRG